MSRREAVHNCGLRWATIVCSIEVDELVDELVEGRWQQHETSETNVRGAKTHGGVVGKQLRVFQISGTFQVSNLSIADLIHIYRPSNDNEYQYSLL